MAAAKKSPSSKKASAKKTPAKKTTKATAKKTTAKAAKKTTAKSTKKAVKKTTKPSSKRTVAAKKSSPKKSAAKKTTSQSKKTTAKKAVTKTTQAKRPSMVAKKPMKAKTKSWYSVLTFSVVVLAVIVAGLLALQPEQFAKLQANILTQWEQLTQAEQNSEEPARVVPVASSEQGVMITWKEDGENEEKLKDIFKTVFPDTNLKEVSFDSEEGQQLIEELGVSEVPAVLYHQDAFEKETLSEVVKDLFQLRNGYYGLNVALVNPSQQLYIGGNLTTQGGVIMGSEDAPLTARIYSDPKCQHCRVNAQNNLEKFSALMEEGLIRLVFLDLPQSASAYHHAIAMACVGQQQPESYLEFRKALFDRANLSESYTNRQLQLLDMNYDQDCDENAARTMLRQRIQMADQEGISGVPAVYLSKTGEDQYVRITGAKDFEEYEQIFDELLGDEYGVEETMDEPSADESDDQATEDSEQAS